MKYLRLNAGFPHRIHLRVALLATAAGFSMASGSWAQLPQINEFLAINAAGIIDEDGMAQPWIEIYNPHLTNPMSLAGYKLTDGTMTWNFPSVQVMPDDRLLVWASGKNRVVTTAPLHTNFTIPATGGTLSLLNGSNAVVSSFVSYPAQTADVSYGRDLSDVNTTATPPATSIAGPNTQVGFYSTPTPGEANSFSGAGVAGEVLFSVPSQAFPVPVAPATFTVSLFPSGTDPDAVIRYTTNRTVPNASSPAYTGPIGITATTLIRARIFKTGLLPGPTQSHGYLQLAANAAGFSSAMPIVAISNFAAGTPPGEGDQASFMWVWEPVAPDNRARFTNSPKLFTRSVIDRRGSSTLDNPKFSLNVEMRQPFNEEDKDLSLLGMPKHSDWVLHAPYNYDRSLLHNPLMYALSNSIGRYAVQTRMAEVFVQTGTGSMTFNGNATGDYFGVYNVMEKIRRSNDRVDIEKLDMYDNDAISKTGGYIWKVDRLDAGDSGFSAGGQNMAYYYPKEKDLKSPQRDPQEQYLTSYINGFNTALQGANSANPTTGYAAWLDVPAAVDHHLLNIWSFNVDALRLSGYWTKDREEKMFPGPIWDFDRTLSSTDGRDADPAVWRSANGDFGTDFFHFTWWNRLFRDIEFYQKYIDRWQSLRRQGNFRPEAVNALIDSLNAEIIAEAVTRDLARWNQSKRAWTRPFPSPNNNTIAASQAAEVQRLKDYLQQRANFFDTQWVSPATASPIAGFIPAGTSVSLSGPAAGTIYYTTDGSDPRPAGGAAPAVGVAAYTAPITIAANTRIRARVYNPAFTALTSQTSNNPPLVSKWSGLTDLFYSIDSPAAPGEVVVSEINYHPTNPTPAELTINPAWTGKDFEFLELTNISNHAVSLDGASFTSGIGFDFNEAASRSLGAGESIVLASNPQAFAARYGASLAVSGPWSGDLANSSETLTLISSSNEVIFSMTYLDSWAPSTDGGGFTLVLSDLRAPEYDVPAAWAPSGQTGGSPGTLSAANPVLTPAEWLAQNPQLGILTGDFDGDGRSNFLEFALNMDAFVADLETAPIVSVENDRLVLTYTRRTSGAGIIYGVEVSNDLSTFRTPAAGELAETIVSEDGLFQTVRVTDTITRGSQPQRFLRLAVRVP
ncbi:MAG: CotH kinase family protein [Verrucomicrobiota bacterium]